MLRILGNYVEKSDTGVVDMNQNPSRESKQYLQIISNNMTIIESMLT